MKPARHLLAIFLTPAAVMAGTSANYTLAPDTVDAGGLRGASANYTLNGSATAGGLGSSANYTARTGFAGQLNDATVLQLNASPLTVNEGGTRQLNATLLFGDSTTSPLAPGSVSWNVQSGPLTGISAAGLATGTAVYQNTAATARGTYQSLIATLNLSVLDIFPDNFGAYAGDGLPDVWQVQHFGVNNPMAAPQLDPDGDTWDNLFEYNACLIPTNPLSIFSMSIAEIAGGGHQVSFSPRLPDCNYTILGSSDLSLWKPVTGIITDAGNVRTILDDLRTEARRFYHIKVLRQ